MKSDTNFRTSFGFTIVELLVVIVVIGILAAITIVSYTGITNRAVIASIQSDLTSASTTLKMDQTINDSFPATLALANSGKGIAQSQSLDSIIYVPDNTSNPKNFCLQYRKGTNTYAVDSSSQVAKGVCLTNLVTNGDFSQGTSGWVVSNGSTSISPQDGVLTMNNDTSAPLVYQMIPQIQLNDIIYVRGRVLSGNSGSSYVRFAISDNGYNAKSQAIINSPTINTWYDISGLGNYNTADNAKFFVQQVNLGTAKTKFLIALDLTATFGAGNEPTQAQMDTIMTNYPNSWFNIVAKSNL